MKKEKRTSFLRSTAIVLCTLFFGALSSCSSDDGGSTVPGGEGKQVKLTITIDGATSEDYISFVSVGSALSNPSENTIWKVNGVTKTNEMAVSLGKNDFIGSTKTYVIESVTPLRLATVGMQFLAPGSTSYTISYKAEINGQVVKEDNNVTVTSTNDYTHDYSY